MFALSSDPDLANQIGDATQSGFLIPPQFVNELRPLDPLDSINRSGR